MATTKTVTDSWIGTPNGYDSTNSTGFSPSTTYPISNAYSNSSSSTYARLTLSTNTTATIYLTFSVPNIPSGATITGVSAYYKARVSSTSRVTNRSVQFCAGTTTKGTQSTNITTSTTNVQTVDGGSSWTLSELSNLTMKFTGTGSSSTQSKYIDIYGATVTVDYTYEAAAYSLTATSGVSGVTVSVSESEILPGNPGTVYIDGDITDCILTDNGTDVTSQIQQQSGGTVTSYPASYTTSGNISGTCYQSAVGQSASTGTETGNDYASGGSGSTAYIDYAFDFLSIPADATITTVSVEVRGHCESTNNSAEVARVQLYSGTTAKGTEYNFTSTSNVTTSMDAGTWTRAELQNAILRFTIGYYGGAVAGVTWTVEYSFNGDHYYYTISSMTTDHTVTISPPTYTVSATTSETDITVSKSPENGTVQSDNTAYVYITGNLNDIQVIDNNVNVTATLSYTDTEANTLPKVIDQYTRTIPYIHEDHTIVVSHSSAQTTYTVTASTSEQSLSLSTSHDSWNNVVGSGRGCVVYINGSDFTNLYVTDNGTNVTSSLVYVSGGTGNSAYYYYYIGNISANHTVVAYLGAPVTTYSVTASTSVSGWQVAVFDGNNQQTTQIEAGDTARVMISGNDYTGLSVTDNGVDVTSLLVYGELGDLSYYGYQITNVQEAHVIVVTQATTYSVTASTSVSGLTLTLSSGGNSGNPLTVNEGSTVILTISGSDLTNLSITDNGTDATSSLVSNNGVTTYTISNVQAAHTLVVSQTITPSTYTVRLVASKYTVSDNNYVTVTNANYLYENTDNTSGYATVRGRNASNTFYTDYFFLHGFNFSAVPENAIISSFTVKIKGYRNSYNSSTYNYLRKSPSTSAGAFSNSFQFSTSQQTLTIPTGDTTWQQLANCDDFTIQLCLNYNTNNSSAYGCVNIYGAEIEVTYTLPFTISASSEVARATIQPASLDVRPGGKSAKFILNTNRGIVLKDNGVDVTSQIAQELDPGYSYSVTNLTDPWGFFLNDDDYYESNIQNERNGSAVCRFDFHLAATGNISFSVINYAEASRDYGIFYKLDTTVDTAYNTDVSGSKVYWSGEDNNSASVQTVTYTGVSAGDHYIYIKYRKNSSTNQYNDSLQFKVALVTITGSYTPGNIYTYTINPVQANHTIVVEQGIMVYDISAASSSSGLTLAITDTTTSATGNPLTITEGHTARLSISSNDLTDLTIMDNGTDVTSSLTTVSGEKQYTITNVQADHTIVIYQSFRITPSMNDNYLGIWLGVKQGNSETSSDYRDVDAGTSCYVQLNNHSNNTSLPQTGITATDNGTNVTSSLVYNNTSNSWDFYRYTLTDVQTDHNVVFGYTGTYYTISASTSTNSGLTIYLGDEKGTNVSGKCFPGTFFDLYIDIEGQDSNLSLVHVTDNGVDVTSSLIYTPAYAYGNYTYPAYYTYTVTNVQANHTLVVSLQKIYLKINGSYVQMGNVYKKISNEWVRQTDYTTLFDNNHIYIHR